MFTTLALTAILLPTPSSPSISGQYLEARTCDIWTGPCFANAEVNLGGKNVVMAWKIDKGSYNNVSLDGLSIIAVVAASDTLGVQQTGPAKAVFVVDKSASCMQIANLVAFAKSQTGDLLKNATCLDRTECDIDFQRCSCKSDVCAVLKAGPVRVETQCLDAKHDSVCGNETAFYPPLAKDVTVKPALAAENDFSGDGLNATWKDRGRRSAYVGEFSVR